MKPIAIAGVLLILLGVVALVYQGFTYTSRETVIDIGPMHRDRRSAEDAAYSTGAGDSGRGWRRGAAGRWRTQARVSVPTN